MERVDDNQRNKCWSDSERARKEIGRIGQNVLGKAAVLESVESI